MNGSETSPLRRLASDANGPVFSEPWQAQALALAVQLNAEGAFTWAEWAEALSLELAGDPTDDGSRYYDHWVAALEALVARRGFAGASELAARKADWAEAYRRTPHGRPVELPASQGGDSLSALGRKGG